MPISGNPGAIPDPDEYQPQLAQQQVRQPPESAPQQPMAQPEAQPQGQPVMFRDVAQQAKPALATAVQGLKRLFGVQASGAIPTEEDQARTGDGPRRFAMNQGAATPEEVRDIDFAGGIDMVQADEGVKDLMRVDRVVNYYLERGNKDMAESAGVSLLMKGARQVKQAGSVAAAALQEYQRTGDPQDLSMASQAIQRAHSLIPDGFDLQLDVDPKTHQLIATTTDSEGKASRSVVDPRAVPGMLQKAMDGSAYWKAVYQLSQPDLAREQMQNEAAVAKTASDRAYNEGYDQFKHERDRGEKLEDREATAAEWDRQQQYLTEHGRSAGERLDAQQEQYFQDWNEQLAAAQDPQQKQAILQEGMGYRYENARDRQTPVADDELAFSTNSQYAGAFDQEDVNSMRNIARVIAAKNATLDGTGAMEAVGILASQPSLQNNPDGTLNAGGMPIIFNPQLLPQLNGLRKKYRVAQ